MTTWQNGKMWLKVYDANNQLHMINPESIVQIFERKDPDNMSRYVIALAFDHWISISREQFIDLCGPYVESYLVPDGKVS